MFLATADAPALVSADTWQQAFIALLPGLEARAGAAFRSVRCPHDRADAVADVVARAWERFRLVARPYAVAADRLGANAVAHVRRQLVPSRSTVGRR